jgi:CDP-diacylglycerol---serine O-phosphatidyltransferase
MKNQLANFVTLLNMFCGLLAIWQAMNGQMEMACLLILAGGIFDFFDGFVARALNASSALGKQLDSLSDVITFGAAPAIMIAYFVKLALLDKGYMLSPAQIMIAVSPCFINAMFAGLRLAKFNIDERQSTSFYGLPSPANGIFFASLSWLLVTNQQAYLFMSNNFYMYYILILLFSFLMIGEFQLFGLKFKQYTWKGNEPKILFLLVCISLVLWLGISGLSLCIVLYIITSLSAKKYFI